MAHLGKNDLTEGAFMRLCETAVSHRVTAGTGRTASQLRTDKNEQLVLANYRCRVTASPTHRLEQFRLWDQVRLDLDFETFRWALMEARCAIGLRQPEAATPTDPSLLPTFHGSLVFGNKSDPSAPGVFVPSDDCVAAEVAQLKMAPTAMREFVKIRQSNRFEPPAPLSNAVKRSEPVRYRLAPSRDVPAGYHKYDLMHCSAWVTLLDCVERETVLEMAPRLPRLVVDSRTLLDRTSYFVGMGRADDEMVIELELSLEPCARDLCGPDAEVVSVGVLRGVMNAMHADSRKLVTACEVKKLLLAPKADQAMVAEAERCVAEGLRA